MRTQTIAQLFDLTGKGAIVTGGAMGIGHAIASRLAEAGAGVMIADIDQKVAEETASQIRAKGGKVKAIMADVSSPADAQKVVGASIDAFGSVDILVNNAAIYPASPTLQITQEAWNKVLNVNLTGTFLYCQAAAQEMVKANKGGKIVNIASASAMHASGFNAHYEASKAGMVMFTKSLALELGPNNITVNAVAPATTRTPSQEQVFEHAASIMGVTAKQLMEGLAARTPLRRLGEPDDIARAVLFLCSAAADYITGALLVVDGGFLLL